MHFLVMVFYRISIVAIFRLFVIELCYLWYVIIFHKYVCVTKTKFTAINYGNFRCNTFREYWM